MRRAPCLQAAGRLFWDGPRHTAVRYCSTALCFSLTLSWSLQILEAKTRKLEQLLRLKDEKIDALEARLRAGHLA